MPHQDEQQELLNIMRLVQRMADRLMRKDNARRRDKPRGSE